MSPAGYENRHMDPDPVRILPLLLLLLIVTVSLLPIITVITHVTKDRTRHPGLPAVQLRLTCDQICTGSESLHVK